MSHRLKHLTVVGLITTLVLAALPLPMAVATDGEVVEVDATDIPVVVTAPYPPTGVAAVAEASSARVSWSSPADDGGSPITGYQVQLSTDDGVTWTSAREVAPGVTSTVVTGLDNGVSYVFQVAAVSAAGVGGWSEPSEAVTPRAAPNRPTVVAGVPGDSRVIVTWVSPADDGGSPITGYRIDYTTDGGASWRPASPVDVAGTSSSFTLRDLDNGVGHRFRVAAVNELGRSSWSYPSPVVAPADDIPVTSPKGFWVSRASDDVDDLDVTWKPVAGAHHYTVSVFDGDTDVARVVDTDDTSLRVDGAGSCASYKVLVAAVDRAGTQARTGVWFVRSAAPGGIQRMGGERSPDGTTGTLTWEPPELARIRAASSRGENGLVT